MSAPVGPVRHSDGAQQPCRRELVVIVPVYKNAASIPSLCDQLRGLRLPPGIEHSVVFVVDGSPDDSLGVLDATLRCGGLRATVVNLSRNFGAFAAIRAGLEVAEGDYFAVIAADLQEPPSLIPDFVECLDDDGAELVLGRREGRADPFFSRLASGLFWRGYRRWVQPSMPLGGVDVFACNAAVRTTILQLDEAHSSLVGQLLWVGYRRATVGYERLARADGKSAWTFSKKLRYLSDNLFSFTDLPIRALLGAGLLGSLIVSAAAIAVGLAWWLGHSSVPGYTPIMLAVLFVGFVLILGLGIVGAYVWRAYENTKRRPLAVRQSVRHYPGDRDG